MPIARALDIAQVLAEIGAEDQRESEREGMANPLRMQNRLLAVLARRVGPAEEPQEIAEIGQRDDTGIGAVPLH